MPMMFKPIQVSFNNSDDGCDKPSIDAWNSMLPLFFEGQNLVPLPVSTFLMRTLLMYGSIVMNRLLQAFKPRFDLCCTRFVNRQKLT